MSEPRSRRAAAPRGTPIERLWDAGLAGIPPGPAALRGDAMPAQLRDRLAGELRVALRDDRPAVLANFVSSLDGVVAVAPGGGGEISGFAEPDRFLMALLRALADAVLVGAGTVRAAPTHVWTSRHVHAGSGDATGLWRRAMGLAPEPTTIVVTGTGDLDLAHPAFHASGVPVVIATTDAGAARLSVAPLPAGVRVAAVGPTSGVSARALVDLAAGLGARVLLCEGGPHLLGEIVAARLLDELFLTLAPQLVGRDGLAGRLGLVEGVAFEPGSGPWGTLRSVHRAGELVFLRYGFG